MATKSVGCCLAHLQSGWDEQVAIFRSRTQLELGLAVVSPSAAISHRDTVILSWTICGSSIWSPDHTHLQTCMLCLTVLWIKRNKLSQTQTRHFFTKVFIYMVLRIFANQKVRRLLQVFYSEHCQTSLTCLSTSSILLIQRYMQATPGSYQYLLQAYNWERLLKWADPLSLCWSSMKIYVIAIPLAWSFSRVPLKSEGRIKSHN